MSRYPRRVYVNLKSELTLCKMTLEAAGFTVYRIRKACECMPGQNMRNAIIAIHEENDSLPVKVIRCRACAKNQKGGQP